MSASAHDLDVAALVAYASALADVAAARREELDARLTDLCSAREEAERAKAACDAACDEAERFARFAARARSGDVDEITLINAAHAIRSLMGGERKAA